jgi:TolA-binding protein
VRVSPADALSAPTRSVQPTTEDDAAAPAATGSSASGPPQGIAPVPTPAWTAFEEKGDYPDSYATARRAGFSSVLRTSSADELLRIAQVCQLTGHADDQRDALLACRRRFPRTQQAALSAYELGRLSPPTEAGAWFEAYLSEQPSGSLAREALGRLLEARASAGDTARAREAAASYLTRYPDGPEAALARRIVSGAR